MIYYTTDGRAEYQLEDPAFIYLLFQQGLTNGVAWCNPRTDPDDPEGSLRSVALNPSTKGERDAHILHTVPPEQIQSVVLSLVDKRAQLLQTQGQTLMYTKGLSAGRLLVFYPQEMALDGLLQPETAGLFDGTNTVAWDTWVYAAQGKRKSSDGSYEADLWYVICWIPPEFESLVDRAMTVMPGPWMDWITESDPSLF
ncbi:MAG: hypothetical protein GYB68_14825 [Chloroflexi bacterium]|nr:hypothetical protein [Chloroflexota bacterium]